MSAFADSLPWIRWPEGSGPPVIGLDAEEGSDRVGLLLAAIDVACGVAVARQLAPVWAATADVVMQFPAELPAGPLTISTSMRSMGARHLVDVSVGSGSAVVAFGEVCLVQRPSEVPERRLSRAAAPSAASVVQHWLPADGPLHADADAVHDGGLVEGGLMAMYAARLAGAASVRPSVFALRFLRPASPGPVQGCVTTSDRTVVELEQSTEDGSRAVLSAWCR